LKLVAVVVAHRLVGMTRQLTPDVPRVVIAFGKVALLLFVSNRGMQLVAIALGGGLGYSCGAACHSPVSVLLARKGPRLRQFPQLAAGSADPARLHLSDCFSAKIEGASVRVKCYDFSLPHLPRHAVCRFAPQARSGLREPH